MDNKLEKFLDAAIAAIESGSQKLSPEIAKMTQEIVAWGTAQHILLIALYLIGTIACWFAGGALIAKAKDWRKQDKWSEHEVLSLSGAILRYVCTVCFMVATTISLYWLTMIALSPRLYILHWLRGFVGR